MQLRKAGNEGGRVAVNRVRGAYAALNALICLSRRAAHMGIPMPSSLVATCAP
jgi:hypothetical protein